MAADFIAENCPRIGFYSGDLRAYQFINELADAIDAAPESLLFGGRQKEHIAYAVRNRAGSRYRWMLLTLVAP